MMDTRKTTNTLLATIVLLLGIIAVRADFIAPAGAASPQQVVVLGCYKATAARCEDYLPIEVDGDGRVILAKR